MTLPNAPELEGKDYREAWNQLRDELLATIKHKERAIAELQREVEILNKVVCGMLRFDSDQP